MNTNELDLLIDRVVRLMQHGQHEAAIELLRRVLSADPDNVDGHALLAQCLLRTKRIHAARHEAALALTLGPNLPRPHLTMTLVALAFQKLVIAKSHAEQALAIDPEDVDAMILLAEIADRQHRQDERRTWLSRARDLEPENVSVIAAEAEAHFERREFDAAARLTEEALSIDPESVVAHVMAGRLALSRGDTDTARQHAVWSLQSAPNDPSALVLLAGIKARKSPLLGLWWRLMTWISIGGMLRSMAILLGMYVVYRVSEITLDIHGYTDARSSLLWVWLGFVVYTWIAPGLFMKALKKELDGVKLNRDF